MLEVLPHLSSGYLKALLYSNPPPHHVIQVPTDNVLEHPLRIGEFITPNALGDILGRPRQKLWVQLTNARLGWRLDVIVSVDRGWDGRQTIVFI